MLLSWVLKLFFIFLQYLFIWSWLLRIFLWVVIKSIISMNILHVSTWRNLIWPIIDFLSSLSIFYPIRPLWCKEINLLLIVWFNIWLFLNLKSLSFRWWWKWWTFDLILICIFRPVNFLCHIKTVIWYVRLFFGLNYNFSISLWLLYCISTSCLIFMLINFTKLRLS